MWEGGERGGGVEEMCDEFLFVCRVKMDWGTDAFFGDRFGVSV